MLLPSANPSRRRALSLSGRLAAPRAPNFPGAGCESGDYAVSQTDRCALSHNRRPGLPAAPGDGFPIPISSQSGGEKHSGKLVAYQCLKR